MSNILTVGDILEVRLPSGVVYASYAGRDHDLGDALWVVPKILPTAPDNWASLFADEGYFVFYPVHAALRQKLLRKVGHALEAMQMVPSAQRTAVRVDEHGAVVEWLITEGSTWFRRLEADMTDAERLLPLAVIWNHAYLIEAIAEDRRPGTRPTV